MKLLQDFPFGFDIATILSQAHIKPESQDGKELCELIKTLRLSMRPKAIYQMCYIQSRQEDAVELGDVCFTSKVLRVNLAQTERVFPFIVTAGTELEEATQQHTDLLQRYCLDLLKEHVLRKAVEHLQTHLKETFSLQHISMMNPGSLEDWPITEQQPLFSIFGDVKQLIGVELTESFLMYPVKSVSGIIFPTEVSYVNCQLCPRAECPSRRAPYDEMLLATKYS